MSYLSVLDEFIIIRIYKFVWIMNMKDVIDEFKRTTPAIVYAHGGVYFYIPYPKNIKSVLNKQISLP
jgi:hypothetical protein